MKRISKLQENIILQNTSSKGVNILVHLFNILMTNDEISCDYTPDTSDKVGHIVVDKKSREIKSIEFSGYEYGKKMYASHVRSKLDELLNSKEPVPKETFSVWY